MGLGAGSYRVTVIDALGCGGEYLFSLTEPALLTAVVDSTAASGEAVADGALTAAGQGGTDPYQYVWSSGDQTPVADMLLPGAYQLTLTDEHGCTFAGAYSVPYTIGTKETEAQPSAWLYPNPAGETTGLYLHDWPQERVVLDCYDGAGKKIWSRSIVVDAATQRVSILVGDLPLGVYRCVLYSSKESRVLPLMISR